MSRPVGRAALRPTAVAALSVTLGALSLHSVLTGDRWFAPVLLVVAVVAVLGAVGRRLSVPPALLVFPQLLGVLVTNTALYAGHEAFAGAVPTTRSVRHLGTLASAGLTELKVVLLPTYPSGDLVLLAVIGVGLIAVAVDLVAVGARRPTFAGMPLVLLVAVPAAIRERSVGNLPLLAAILGFLLLLSLDAEERAGRWGRVLPGGDEVLPSALAGNAGKGLQIGLASIALAVIVPLAVPGATTSPFGSSEGLGAGNGHDSAVIVDPLVSIASELRNQSTQTLLTVQSPTSTYLRLTALEDFTDAGFTLGPVTAGSNAKVAKGLPAADTLAGPQAPQTITETIHASPNLQERLLPVPAGSTAVNVSGDWRLSAQTRTVFSSDETTSGRRWTVTDVVTEPSATQLSTGGQLGAPASSYSSNVLGDLTVPGDLPAAVHTTAAAWTRGATTAFEAATDIQDHFTDGSFRYDTGVAYQGGPDGFVQFLSQRTGFCEQYATTMVAMLRSLGVPARVAIGFVGGSTLPDGDFAVTGGDAHAWPEVWFQGTGWVRFEPTPRTDAATPGYTHPAGTGPVAPVAPGTSVAPAPSTSSSPGQSSLSGKLSHLAGDGGAAGGTSASVGGHALRVWPWALGATVLLLVAAAAPGAVAGSRRRRRLGARGPGSVEGLWAQLLDDAFDRGVGLRSADSPRATGRRLLETISPYGLPLQDLRTAAARLVTAVELARYAPGSDGRSSDELVAAEIALRRGLEANLSRPVRWGAVLAPASARQRVIGQAVGLWPRALGAVDTLVSGRRRHPRAAG